MARTVGDFGAKCHKRRQGHNFHMLPQVGLSKFDPREPGKATSTARDFGLGLELNFVLAVLYYIA